MCTELWEVHMQETKQRYIKMRQELVLALGRSDLNPLERLSYRYQIHEIDSIIRALEQQECVKKAFESLIHKKKTKE